MPSSGTDSSRNNILRVRLLLFILRRADFLITLSLKTRHRSAWVPEALEHMQRPGLARAQSLPLARLIGQEHEVYQSSLLPTVTWLYPETIKTTRRVETVRGPLAAQPIAGRVPRGPLARLEEMRK